jgi:hypothetical protein
MKPIKHTLPFLSALLLAPLGAGQKKSPLPVSKRGEDKLRFGSDANGLSAAQLSQISFDGQPAQIDADGYVTP